MFLLTCSVLSVHEIPFSFPTLLYRRPYGSGTRSVHIRFPFPPCFIDGRAVQVFSLLTSVRSTSVDFPVPAGRLPFHGSPQQDGTTAGSMVHSRMDRFCRHLYTKQPDADEYLSRPWHLTNFNHPAAHDSPALQRTFLPEIHPANDCVKQPDFKTGR